MLKNDIFLMIFIIIMIRHFTDNLSLQAGTLDAKSDR